MQLGDEDMAHLLKLARLELAAEEAEQLKADLSRILDYFNQLAALDTEGVAPLARPIEHEGVYRDDVLGTPLPQTRALALAIEQEAGFFKVPRTVDSDA